MSKPKKSTNKAPRAASNIRIQAARNATRRINAPKHQFKLRGRIKPVRPPIKNAFRLFGQAVSVLKKHWRLFVWIVAIYAVLDFVLVRGLSGGLNLSSIKNSIDHTTSSSASLSTGFTLFVYLLGNSGSSNTSSTNAGVYQTILIIIVSLTTIWALRQVYNEAKVRARDAFYKGMYPLIPFVLILLVIGLQLIPLLIGGTIYSIVVSNGIAIGLGQELIFGLIFLLLAVISLYMLCSSIFALYISTLPDMTPMKALRSARELVRYRRLTVLRKILFLPLALLVIAAVIMVPIILIITPAASWIFLLLSLASIVVIHSYMYALYRELLNE